MISRCPLFPGEGEGNYKDNMNRKSSIIVIIVLAVGFSCLEGLNPGTVYALYAYPAAFLASLFLGSHPVWTLDKEIWIPLIKNSIHVTPSCSAFGFFCLLNAMVVVHLFYRFNKQKAFLFTILAAPVVYGITIVTNGSRIICAYQANEIGKLLLPSNFQAALHLGVGITIFLSVLMAAHLWLERAVPYEYK